MSDKPQSKLPVYQVAVILSVLFTLVGFSYNVWRMEISEENSTKRTACFEILINLASLEQLVYAAHYDGDEDAGNPRNGWVLVGLIADLSVLADDTVSATSEMLKQTWSASWQQLPTEREQVDHVISAVDEVRGAIKDLLVSLE